MPSGSVDVVFTSPPYNLQRRVDGEVNHWLNVGKYRKGKTGKKYATYRDDMLYKDYVLWQRQVLLECWRVLNNTGAIFYNHKPRIQDGICYTPLDLNPGIPVRQVIIWKRGGAVNFSPSFFLPMTEWIVLFAKPDFRLRDRAVSGIGDVWEIHQGSPGAIYNPHPAPFPVELPLRALQALPTTAKTVLDPFCGSGSTGVACVEAKKMFIGIDISQEYCDMARKRIYLAQQGDFSSWNAAGG